MGWRTVAHRCLWVLLSVAALASHHLEHDRQVCVMQDTPGSRRCRPVYCDNGQPAAWQGRIVRKGSHRGTVMQKRGQARHGSGCAVSDQYRFVYIHVLKSGGMSIKGMLRQALCDGGRFDDTAKACELGAGGSARLRIQDCSSAVRDHPSYTVFAFVRNPFRRWISIYAMAAAYARRDEFPLSLEQFVRDPELMRKATRLSRVHWAPQTAFILDSLGCPAVDFVGQLERIDSDFQRVLQLIGRPRELVRFLDQNSGVVPHASATSFGQSAHKNNGSRMPLNVASVRAIQQRSASEFEALGYDTNPDSNLISASHMFLYSDLVVRAAPAMLIGGMLIVVMVALSTH